MIKNIHPFCLLAVITMLFSCKAVYQPNMINTPLLKQKDEFKLSAGNNNIQASYAVKDHVGIMANGYFRKNTDQSSLDTTKTKGTLFEGGIGYFKSFNHIVIEGYSGLGFGTVSINQQHKDNANSPVIPQHFDCNAAKLFLQPSIGFVHEYFDIAFTPRFSVVKYATPSIINYTQSEQDENKFTGIQNSVFVFFEPAITLRGGYKYIKAYFQIGQGYKISGQAINFDNSMKYLGLQIDLAKWYRNDK